jgi:hypothetical protein
MHKLLIHKKKKFHCHFLKENYEAPKTWMAVYLIKPSKIKTDLRALLSKHLCSLITYKKKIYYEW